MRTTKLKWLLICSIAFASCPMAKAQNPGNGSSGPKIISSTITIDDERAAIEEITYPGGNTASVKLDAAQMHGTWTGVVGSRVLIIIMAKTGTSPTRNWQIMTINSYNVANKTFTTDNFQRTNWPTGTLNYANCKMQAIIVPQYTTVVINPTGTLTCNPWDGFTGGVVAFLANDQLTINNGGWIDVSEKGFNNTNNGGLGGINGGGGIAPGSNSVNNPDFGVNGDGYDFDVRAKGQCLTGPNTLLGGDGGTGGFKIKGSWGEPGGDRGSRLNLTRPAPPKMLALGNAGVQGRGGRGGDGGGSGANGGNGFSKATGFTTSGVAGADGGNGGNGGTGGGLIIAIALQISIPHTSNCIDLSASNGTLGQNGITLTNGGQGGDGSNGGDAGYDGINDIGYGGLGTKGQRGNGSGGGDGGGGGSIGSFSIRTINPNVNPLAKAQHVKYTNGTGGTPGLGGNYCLTPGVDGINGYVSIALDTATKACEKRVYDVYPCAAAEAYQVLGDMDWAVDYGYYIEYRKRDGKGNSKKGANLAFAMRDTDYYCLYFKCSKLIMAFEPNGTPPLSVFGYDSINGDSVIDHYAVKHNLYWSKLEDVITPTGANCNDLHTNLQVDINNANFSIPQLWTGSGTASHPVSLLTHHFGKVLYGANVGGAHKFVYEDITPYAIFEEGTLKYNNSSSIVGCRKVCPDDTFRFDWVRYAHCEIPPSVIDSPPTSSYPSNPSYPSPRVPKIAIIWDNPAVGKSGNAGSGGEGDDDNFEGGDVPPGGGGDDEPETPIYQHLNELSNQGKYAFVAPNPATTQLLISTKGQDFNGQVNLTITDVTGKVVLKQQRMLHNVKPETINIEEFTQGIYFIEINATHYREILKFVKQ